MAVNSSFTYSGIFFFTGTATAGFYTLSLHDALPISRAARRSADHRLVAADDLTVLTDRRRQRAGDRKSTRLNSSHRCISYAVFCLKKKKKPISAMSEPVNSASDVD